MHSFSMRYLRFAAQDLPWNGVDVVVSETDGLFWHGWLAAWLSGKHNLWLGFIVRGESRPHELFSFIWRCYCCSLSAFACLPLFNLSPHHLLLCPSLSLPACLSFGLTILLLLCDRRDAAVRGTNGRLLQTSVTLATAASPALALSLPPCYATRNTKAPSSPTPCSYWFLYHLLHAFPLLIFSSSFPIHSLTVLLLVFDVIVYVWSLEKNVERERERSSHF